MTATNNTLQCEQGATFSYDFIWKDSAGNLVDTTNYTARMQVRVDNNTNPMATLTNANSKLVLGGVNGKVTAKLTANETSALNPGDFFYDLEMESGTGVVTRVYEGVFSVKREITK